MDYAQEKLVVAGTNAGVAYEKAKMMWNLRSQGAGGKAAAQAAGGVDKTTGDVNKVTKRAGVDAPITGDVAYQGFKADQDVKKAGVQPPKLD